MSVVEIGQTKVEQPDGYVGNLTDEQDKKLREAWKQYFKVLDEAKGGGGGGGKKGGGGGGEEMADDPKKAGISNDDNAKEEAKAQEEEQGLKELQDRYGAEALKEAFWKFVKLDDPDTCLLRFLRARKWDVRRAVAMLAKCMLWRLDNGIEDLASHGDEGNASIEKFLDQQRSGKTYAFGASSGESPCCYIHVRKHFTKGQPQESMQKYVAYAMESFRLLLVPPNDKVVLFFDLNKFGLANMDWGCILYIVKCLEAYFPESLHTLIVYKAPWIFSGIWKILAPLLDPVVRSKVVFMSKPSECEHLVPADRLIAELGGDVDFEFTKAWVEPREGENKVDEEERKKRGEHYQSLGNEYEEVTKKWAEGDTSKELLEKRHILVKKLRVAQFEKEPFVRGKTQLHRDGTLDGQGIVTWNYKQKDGKVIRHIVGRRHCAAVLKRELKEIEEDGKSISEVEKKSDEALEKEDWATLYGGDELAQKIEGPRAKGQTPPEGNLNKEAITVVGVPAGTLPGPADGQTLSPDGGGPEGATSGAVGGGGGDDDADAGGGSAAPPDSKDEDFKDAPQADKQTVQKAVSKDHIASGADEKAAQQEGGAKSGHPQNGDAKVANGDAKPANGGKENGNGSGGGGGADAKEKVKTAVVDKPKEKTQGLGRRLSKMINKK
ncbi:unnamed protein product [Jaminaea pallidilutea]